jgi:uncharacterized protein
VIAIYPYQTQAVRDLAWACFSPAMLQADQLGRGGQVVADCAPALTGARRLWLEQLDRDATRLHEHLARQRSHRLGVYFEHLWHFFLDQDPDYELVAHNLPVHDGGRTLGEFDCIYHCHERQRYIHLELAVKFYLGYGAHSSGQAASQWREWLGPNSRDRLDLKVEHLMQHQLQLGEHPRARELLSSLGIPSLHKELAIKGYLFQPITSTLPPPLAFNSQSRMEQWLSIDQLQQYLASIESRHYLRLPRKRWLAGAYADPQAQVLEADELQQTLRAHFDQDSRAQLVAALDQSARECHRFFVTATDWPASS